MFKLIFILLIISHVNVAISQVNIEDEFIHKHYSNHSYICIPDKIAGFYYNQAQHLWNGATAETHDKKIFLQWKNNNWIWSIFGEKENTPCNKFEYPMIYNAEDENQPYFKRKYWHQLRCSFPGGELIFSLSSLRYMLTRYGGYINGEDVERGSSSIVIGKCIAS